MMVISPISRLRPALVFSTLLALVVLVEYLIIQRPDFTSRPALPVAVTFDLVVGIPLLFYLAVVRPYRLPATTLVAVFGGALAIGRFLVPPEQQQYLAWAGRSLGVLEVGVLGITFLNLHRLRRAYRTAALGSADFLDNLTTAFTTVFRRPMAPLVWELAMFRYAFLGWWAKPEVAPEQTAFSLHRNSGFGALMAAFVMLSIVETTAVHLLVGHWNATAAKVLLVLDGYTVLVLLAHLCAVGLRPITLAQGQLKVRIGFVWRCEVAVENITRLEELRDTPAPDKQTINLARLLFTPPNVALTFARPLTLVGPYGVRRSTSRITLYVDDRVAFVQRLRAAGACSPEPGSRVLDNKK